MSEVLDGSGGEENPPGWGCLIGFLVVLVAFSILFLNGTIPEMLAGEDDPSPTTPTTTTTEPLG